MALGLGRGKERREGRGWGAELRRNNRPKGEFFLFPPPLPFCPPLQTEICEAVCADGRKARTLNWTKPPQPLLGRRGYPASVAICQKKKRKKGKRKEKKRWSGREKKYESLLAGTRSRMCEHERMTVRR